MEGLNSPIIQKYELALDQNPSSRVFAPLAESYRKIGMVDRALQTLRQGIKNNPDYALGHIGLAHCYYDMGEFNLSYTTLKPMIDNNQENLRLLKLYAKVCVEIGNEQEALEKAKYLMFLNPRDKEAAKIVKDLEDKTEASKIQYQMALDLDSEEHQAIEVEVQNLNAVKSSIENVDSWVKVDFPEQHDEVIEDEDLGNWNLKKQEVVLEEELPENIEQAEEERTFIVKEKVESVSPISDLKAKKVDTPVITHTLVDLYCSQGHVEKAVEILEKILELNPNDQRTIEKLSEVKQLLVDSIDDELDEVHEEKVELSETKDLSEEDGRQNLMSYFDQKFDNEHCDAIDTYVAKQKEQVAVVEEHDDTIEKIENLFWSFHTKLSERASIQLSK